MTKSERIAWQAFVCVLVVGLCGYMCAYAVDRPMYKKAPLGPGAGGDEDPDVPGCESVTAGQECLRRRSCVDSLDHLSCCRLADSSCMTLVNQTASGVMVWSAAGELLPGDFIYALDSAEITASESTNMLLAVMKDGPRASVLRVTVDPWGERHTMTLEVPIEPGFLWTRAVWMPDDGIFWLPESGEVMELGRNRRNIRCPPRRGPRGGRP